MILRQNGQGMQVFSCVCYHVSGMENEIAANASGIVESGIEENETWKMT